jgi:hypothetical protein
VTVVKELIRLDLWTSVKEILCATSHHVLSVPHTVVQFDLRNTVTLKHIPQSAGPPHLSEFRHEHLDDGMIWVGWGNLLLIPLGGESIMHVMLIELQTF